MTKQKKQYCKYCGSIKQQIQGNRFDEKTGKNIPEYICSNLQCEYGCEKHGGHNIPFFGTKCKRCGTIPYSLQGF